MPRAATKASTKRVAKTAKKTVKKAAAKPRGMSPAHKAALAQGRRESRAINKYLDALKAGKGKRGRKRTPSSIEARLSKIARTFETASPMQQLELTQEKMNLDAEKLRLDTQGRSLGPREGIRDGRQGLRGAPRDLLFRLPLDGRPRRRAHEGRRPPHSRLRGVAGR